MSHSGRHGEEKILDTTGTRTSTLSRSVIRYIDCAITYYEYSDVLSADTNLGLFSFSINCNVPVYSKKKYIREKQDEI
jgi:hypothetical protein